MRQIMVVLATVAALFAGSVPAAAAGAWAVTYLDPVPSRFAGGQSYALGFWVLQHGTHPFEGKMEPVGLRLTKAGGEVLEFAGTPLPEAGHYVTSVVVPEGVWKVAGVQGPFEPYEVGTLTVPGSLRIDPVPENLADTSSGVEDFWGAVRPPGFAPGKGTVSFVTPSAPAPVSAPVSASAQAPVAATAPTRPDGVPAYTLLPAAAGGAVLAWAALRLRGRRREEEPGPDRPSADTIVISG
ncbi:hypothetical protein ACWEPC_09710 [Nonomuraea sp. NPDC004297]